MSNRSLRVVACGVAVLLGFSLGRPHAYADPAADQARTLPVLIQQGADALAAGDFEAARDALLDAKSLQDQLKSNSPLSPDDRALMLESLAVAYMRLNDFESAHVPLDKACGASPSTDSLLVNHVALDLVQKRYMRAVKETKDYLTRHRGTLSEPVLNLLGTALNYAADSHEMAHGPFYDQAVQFYLDYDAKLDATRPGYKRWGPAWLADSDFVALQKNIKIAQGQVEGARSRLAVQVNNLRAVELQGETLGGGGANSMDGLANSNLGARAAYNQAVSDYNDALANVPRPSWPRAIEPVLPSFVLPAGITPVDANASWLGTSAGAPPQASGSTAAGSYPVPGGRPAYPPPGQPASLYPPAQSTIYPPPQSQGAPLLPAAPAPAPQQPQAPQSWPAAADNGQAAVHRVTSYAAAFPIASDLLITAFSAVRDATHVQVQDSTGQASDVTVVRKDSNVGLALLRISARKLRYLNFAANFNGTNVKCAAFPDINIFNPAPELLSGTAAATDAGYLAHLPRHPRLPGAVLLDKDNNIVGVVLASRGTSASQLPSLNLGQVKAFCGSDIPANPCGNPDPVGVFEVSASYDK